MVFVKVITRKLFRINSTLCLCMICCSVYSDVRHKHLDTTQQCHHAAIWTLIIIFHPRWFGARVYYLLPLIYIYMYIYINILFLVIITVYWLLLLFFVELFYDIVTAVHIFIQQYLIFMKSVILLYLTISTLESNKG